MKGENRRTKTSDSSNWLFPLKINLNVASTPINLFYVISRISLKL